MTQEQSRTRRFKVRDTQEPASLRSLQAFTRDPLWPMNLANGEAMDEKNEHRLQPEEVAHCRRRSCPRTPGRRRSASGFAQTEKASRSRLTRIKLFTNAVYSLVTSSDFRCIDRIGRMVSCLCSTTTASPSGSTATIAALQEPDHSLGTLTWLYSLDHESPGFSLISYRRSGNNGSGAGCDLPAIDVASSTKFTAVDFDSPVGWASAEPSTRTNEEIHANTYRFQQGQEEKQQKQFDNRSAFPLRGGTEDKYLWQYRLAAINCGFREKGQHLLILWRFLQSHSLRDLKFTEAASTQVRSFCLQAAASFRSPNASPLHYAVGSLLSSIFKHSPATYMDRECTIIRVTAHLFLRALSSHTVQRLLQERFLLLISDVYDALGGVLHEVLAESGSFTRGNQHASIPTLVDEVLSLVYIQPRFRHLRVGFVALLMDQRPAGSLSDTLNCAFQAFTALTREGMIASVTRYRNSRRLGVNDLIWNQRWLLGPGSVQLFELLSGFLKMIVTRCV
ncbi:hypothetical protein GQ600_13092 [Phytophthora cactorum]|nr:hypothetical protein GQ600_13092 [Phytophthora cactorum]